MINLRNVSFEYAGNAAGRLQNINIDIADGECVLLCGRSGCGKTTILRLINGLIPDYFDGELKGEVLYNGENISEMEMYERAKFAGSVFQNPRTQFFNVDTDSEIAFGMENLSLPRDLMLQRMDEITERLKLKALRRRSIFELSGGEKQRIAFASVYAMHPEVYLLDEPSSNLDADSIEDLREQLRVIKAEGKSILIAEHRIYYLMDLGLRTIHKRQSQVPKCQGSIPSQQGLTFDHVSIKRNKRILQSDITFSAAKGDIIGIIGENGAGKTTFLRTICGLYKDYEGQILIDGKQAAKKKLIQDSYMVMQDVNYELFADSVKNECRLGIKKADEQLIDRTLQELALDQFKERHPNTLSGGQKQRVAVAVSQVCGKKLLTFDEPTSGLDYDSMMQVANLIRRLAKEAIIMIVTHDVEFLNSVCTQIYELKREK